MNGHLKKIRFSCKSRKGTVLIEFALAIPVYLLAICCFFQLILIVHARIMINYASFHAARAGVVSNANLKDMKIAASIALSPLFVKNFRTTYPASSEDVSNGMRKVLGKFQTGQIVIEFLNPQNDSLISPQSVMSRLNNSHSLSELSQHEKVLKIRLKYYFPLRIPLADAVFYNGIKHMLTAQELALHPLTIPIQAVYTLRITGTSRGRI